MSRSRNVLKNAKVGIFFLMLTFVLGMYSRKIFLDGLGADFIGLTTTLLAIIGFLSITELGFGVAITSSLYKPLSNKETRRISEIISLVKYFYQRVALVLFIGGCFLSLFLPKIFANEDIDLKVVYFSFWGLLVPIITEYLINYRKILLIADQKLYVSSKYEQTGSIIKVILQVISVKVCQSQYIWILIATITPIILSHFNNQNAKKIYPDVVILKIRFDELIKLNWDIVIKTKQLLFHKISAFIFKSSDQAFTYVFSNLATVALLGGYQTVAAIVQSFIGVLNASLTSSVGNYVNDSNDDLIYKLYEKLYILHWLAATIITYCFYNLIDPFITLWLGDTYLLGNDVKLMMSINVLMFVVKSINESFIGAYGLFHDIKAPIVEVIINIIVSALAGYYFGVAGVLLGTCVSVFVIAVVWKSFLLYKIKFNLSSLGYFVLLFKCLATCIVSIITTNYLISPINIGVENDSLFLKFIMDCMVEGLVIMTVAVSFFFMMFNKLKLKRLLNNFKKNKM